MSEVLSIIKHAMLVEGVNLLHAIYFKGSWVFCFEETRNNIVECFVNHCTSKLGPLNHKLHGLPILLLISKIISNKKHQTFGTLKTCKHVFLLHTVQKHTAEPKDLSKEVYLMY